MGLARGVLVVLATAVLVTAAAAPAAQAPSVDSPPSATGPPALSTALAGDGTVLAADSTAIEVSVRPDGTAAWAVHYRVELAGPNETAAFDRVSRRIEAAPLNYTGPYAERMQHAASIAAEDTGRAMSVGNVTVSARQLPTGYGVVTYRFTWTGFAARSDGRLVVGDALAGFFLDDERTTLAVRYPTGYAVDRVSPSPDDTRDGAVLWRGPVEFGPDEPRVVVSGGGALPVDPGNPVAVAAVVVALALVAAVVWRRRRGRPAVPGVPGGDRDTADGSAEPAETGASGGAGGASEADESGAVDEVPAELLSDPERVLDLVEANGGRMKQQAVVEQLDWSETKTSQVVGDLREADELEVYRIGRENVLSLPGEMDV